MSTDVVCACVAADVALTQRLAEELKYETESAQQTEPEFLKAFKAQGTWAVSRVESCSVRESRRVTWYTIFSPADRGQPRVGRGHPHSQIWQRRVRFVLLADLSNDGTELRW